MLVKMHLRRGMAHDVTYAAWEGRLNSVLTASKADETQQKDQSGIPSILTRVCNQQAATPL